MIPGPPVANNGTDPTVANKALVTGAFSDHGTSTHGTIRLSKGTLTVDASRLKAVSDGLSFGTTYPASCSFTGVASGLSQLDPAVGCRAGPDHHRLRERVGAGTHRFAWPSARRRRATHSFCMSAFRGDFAAICARAAVPPHPRERASAEPRLRRRALRLVQVTSRSKRRSRGRRRRACAAWRLLGVFAPP
jgi:hypothetical protein